MISNSQTNSAVLAQIIIEGKLEALLSEFNPDIVADFLEKALSDDKFGQTGHYTFFCKNCGGQWSFISKDEKRIFEKLHKFTGCSFEWELSKSKNWQKKRSKQNINLGKVDIVKSVIDSLRDKSTQQLPITTNKEITENGNINSSEAVLQQQ